MSKQPKTRQRRKIMDEGWNVPSSASAPAVPNGSGGDEVSEHSTDDVTEMSMATDVLDYDQDEEEEIMNAIPSGKLEKMRDKRNNIATEILTTERTYVTNLDIMVQVYMDPLNRAVADGIITKDDMSSIFGNCRIIRGYNQLLLQDLEQRLTDWSDTQRLGDVFLKMVVFLKTYTQYINAFDNSRGKLKALSQENAAFKALLDELNAHPRTGRQNLKDYLIMPVQRIPRYTMLLRDLWSATWPSHPDYDNLLQAYTKMEEITQFVEDGKEKACAISKIAEIQSRLMGKKSDNLRLVKPSRTIVKEGELVEIIKGDQLKSRYVYLFNDYILITKPRKGGKLEIRHASPLHKLSSIKQVSCGDNMRGLEFQLGAHSVQLQMEKAEDDISPWFKSLLESYMDAMEVRQKFLKASTEESLEEHTDHRKAKSLRGARKPRRLSMQSKTAPASGSAGRSPSEERVTKTQNPLFRLQTSSAPKRSTITYGDVVQAEMRSVAKITRKTKGGRVSTAKSTGSDGTASDDEEEFEVKRRACTFAETPSGGAAGGAGGRRSKPSFMRSISVENLKHTIITAKKSASKDV